MDCPLCKKNMTQEQYESVQIDVCPSCKGVWLDQDELGRVVSTQEETFTMDAIKKTLDETVAESRKMLTLVMESLEKDKDKIKTNIQSAQREQNNIGPCPKCGKNLVIRSSKQGKRFVGCTGFPDCKNTYSLPQNGSVVKTDNLCKKCNTPVVKVRMKDKKPWNLCLNSDCPGKKSRNNNSA